MKKVLTVNNSSEFYRVFFNELDFGNDYQFDSNKVKKSVEENGLVFTACDYNVYAVVIKRLLIQ